MKKSVTLLCALLLSIASFSQNSSDVKSKFLAMLNGSETAAQKAIDTFGSEEVIENGMIPFGKNPTVTSTDGDCVRFTLSDDGDLNAYVICSSGDKIISFDWDDDAEEDYDEED
jgi:hypothetical protein